MSRRSSSNDRKRSLRPRAGFLLVYGAVPGRIVAADLRAMLVYGASPVTSEEAARLPSLPRCVNRLDLSDLPDVARPRGAARIPVDEVGRVPVPLAQPLDVRLGQPYRTERVAACADARLARRQT